MACTPPTITVGGVILSTSDFQNAQELLKQVGGAGGDPTLDEYDENVAGGNNSEGKSGILVPSSPDGKIPTQTSLPPPIAEAASETNDKAPPGKSGTPISGSTWNGSYETQLSPNFKLSQFTIKALYPFPLTDYSTGGKTFTAQERFVNLQNLAQNVAEPLLTKYGSFRVNSGIRNKTSTSSGISQHITGQAMDVQFAGWNYARYWEAAQWVKENLAFDQFIFEHGNMPWLHLSFSRTGNRAPTGPTKVMTMYRNQYSPGLRRYG
jgi:Peptidase M15